jgi:hypothetical protein
MLWTTVVVLAVSVSLVGLALLAKMSGINIAILIIGSTVAILKMITGKNILKKTNAVFAYSAEKDSLWNSSDYKTYEYKDQTMQKLADGKSILI